MELELFKEIFPTVTGSIITSIAILIFSESIKENYIQTTHKYKELKGKISYSLSFYANIYANPIDLYQIAPEDKKI